MTYQPYSNHNNTPNLQKAKIFGSDPAFLSLFLPLKRRNQGIVGLHLCLHHLFIFTSLPVAGPFLWKNLQSGFV
jgi:hypothetical protein